jgi:hypothetical protein
MRILRLWPLYAVLVLGGATTAYVWTSLDADDRIARLASQPEVATVFQQPETARSDALTTLVAAFVLTPIVLFVIGLLFAFASKLFESVLQSLQLPGALSLPVVVAVAVSAMYVTSAFWLPTARYGAGVCARAYLVYSATSPPLFH